MSTRNLVTLQEKFSEWIKNENQCQYFSMFLNHLRNFKINKTLKEDNINNHLKKIIFESYSTCLNPTIIKLTWYEMIPILKLPAKLSHYSYYEFL